MLLGIQKLIKFGAEAMVETLNQQFTKYKRTSELIIDRKRQYILIFESNSKTKQVPRIHKYMQADIIDEWISK